MKIIENLKARRIRLGNLVADNLSKQEMETLNPYSDGILDSKAYLAVMMLLEKCIRIPDPLTIGLQELATCPDRGDGDGWISIYSHALDVETANMFYGSGFHDIDGFCNNGYPPLFVAVFTFRPGQLDYIAWLVNKGANLLGNLHFSHKGSKYAEDWSISHYVLQRVGWDLLSFKSMKWPSITTLLRTILPIRVRDNCICHCSVDGCQPATGFLKTVFHRTPMTLVANYMPSLIDKISQSVEDASNTIFNHLVRFLTFTFLGITHTCCDIDRRTSRHDYYPKTVEEIEETIDDKKTVEEIEEIHDEEKDALKLLEELIKEFEIEYRQSTKSLTEFFCYTWLERMNAVRAEQESRKMTADQKAAAEELGVVWDDEDGDDSTASDVSSNLNSMDTDGWLDRLAEIVPIVPE